MLQVAVFASVTFLCRDRCVGDQVAALLSARLICEINPQGLVQRWLAPPVRKDSDLCHRGAEWVGRVIYGRTEAESHASFGQLVEFVAGVRQ